MDEGGVGNSFFEKFSFFPRWYLLVIVLLYIGLITSFCLNVTLLVRREPERVVRLEEMARTGTGEIILMMRFSLVGMESHSDWCQWCGVLW